MKTRGYLSRRKDYSKSAMKMKRITDKMRLDWMEKHPFAFTTQNDPDNQWILVANKACGWQVFKTLRDATDAAIRSQTKGKKKCRTKK